MSTTTLEPVPADTAEGMDRAERIRRGLPQSLYLTRADGRLVLAHMIVAFASLLLGAVAGLLQALERSGRIDLPSWLGYYQLLTAHGVLMALAFTTFFIYGFLYAGLALTLSLGGELDAGPRGIAWLGFWMMTLGAAITIVPIVLNDASVLYTFYAPMKAAPAFYIGLTLVVVGTWVGSLAVYNQYWYWRGANTGNRSPLFAYMAMCTLVLWQVATLGVAAEMLLQLIPWSLGWVPTINVLLSRTLFWFFGHPLVYFWLLPAYMAWYLCMPRLIGGRVFSDPLARITFLMLMVFSIPVGLHHQLMEPGISQGFKLFQVGLTLAVVLPSLMTAFAMFGTMERAGRARGYGGLFGWLRKLPWRDARFTAMFVGMFMFIPGGVGGIINASYHLDSLVHNTLWVTGHFHLTVATTAALTFMGVAYWLVPHAAGRRYTPAANRWALVQVGLWTIGMTIMSTSMHIVGVLGEPRRTSYVRHPSSETSAASWHVYDAAMGVGGSLLFLSVLVCIGLLLYLGLFAPEGQDEFVLAEIPAPSEAVPTILERWGVWMGLIAVLVVAAYTAPIVHVVRMAAPGSKPFTTYKKAQPARARKHTGGSAAKPVQLGNDAKTVAARKLFTSTCGGCHTLGDAATSGTVGPQLDGLALTSDEVYNQVLNGGGSMPPGLLQGDDAHSVADYVAAASGNATGAAADTDEGEHQH